MQRRTIFSLAIGTALAVTIGLSPSQSHETKIGVVGTKTGRLAAAAESHLTQILGNTVLLYRPDPDEPQIVLPD